MKLTIVKADVGKQEHLVKVQEKKSGSRAARTYYRKQKKNVENNKAEDKDSTVQPLIIKIKQTITDIWQNIADIAKAVLGNAADKIKNIKTKAIQKRTMSYVGMGVKLGAMDSALTSIGAGKNYIQNLAYNITGAIKALRSEFNTNKSNIGNMTVSDALKMKQPEKGNDVTKSFKDSVVDEYVYNLEKALNYDGDDEGVNVLQNLIDMSDDIDDEITKHLSRFKEEEEKKFDEQQIKKDLDEAEKILREIPHHFKEALIKYRNKRKALHNTNKKGE